jgi:diguanylate cyclase
VNDQVIELGLRGHGNSVVPALRGAVDVVIRMLGELVSALETPSGAELHGRLEACRTGLAGEQSPQAIAALADQCADVCQALVAHFETQKTQKQREVGTLIDLVREAMSSIAGDAGQFDASLGQSMERFEALGRLNNVQEMQARLASEVMALKQMATVRRKTWDSRFASFGQRIAALEDQLVATRQEVTTDPLTRIANRIIFDRACREWTQSARLQFSLVLVQVDALIEINGEHGHPTGDRVLVAVAEALRAVARTEEDIVARLGGGDFALLVDDLALPQLEGRLRAAITRLSFGVEGSDKARVKPALSIGITDSGPGDTSESLIERAGQALLEARRGGRNRIVVKSKPLLRDLIGNARKR